MNQVNLPGLVQLPKLFKVMRRKKIRQYRDDSRNEEQMNAGEEQPIVPNVTQIPAQMPAEIQTQMPAEIQTQTLEVDSIPIITLPKKRGPKPKVTESNLGGRPPLARNALEDDSAEPILRRSARTKKL